MDEPRGGNSTGGQADGIRFDGQVAVVTGAGGGLGRIYALELARRGARVVVNDLGGARDGSGSLLRRRRRRRPRDHRRRRRLPSPTMTRSPPSRAANASSRSALDHFGRLDILINNAGILRDKSFAKMTPDMWQAVLDVHLQGAFNVTHPAFQVMRQQGYGRIVMTTSAAGLFGNFGQANYGAAKMGLVGLMNTLKLEGAKYDIKVNTVAPLAATRLTEDVLPPDFADKLKPEFVAPLVLYLCSEQCPVSGANLQCRHGHLQPRGRGERTRRLAGRGRATARARGDCRQLEADHLSGGRRGIPRRQRSADGHAVGPQGAARRPGSASTEQSPAGGPPASVQAVFDSHARPLSSPRPAAGVNVVFQFTISGPGGGDWHAVDRGRRVHRRSPASHDKPTTTLKMSAEDFLEYVGGQLPAMQAYTSGKLKIEGDLMKSQLVEKLFKF